MTGTIGSQTTCHLDEERVLECHRTLDGRLTSSAKAALNFKTNNLRLFYVEILIPSQNTYGQPSSQSIQG